MDVPVVIALNMMDILEKNKEKIDVNLLSKNLGVPVVPISALKDNNLKELIDVTIDESKKRRVGATVLKDTILGDLINNLKNSLKENEIPNPLFHAIKLIEDDSLEKENHKKEYQ